MEGYVLKVMLIFMIQNYICDHHHVIHVLNKSHQMYNIQHIFCFLVSQDSVLFKVIMLILKPKKKVLFKEINGGTC